MNIHRSFLVSIVFFIIIFPSCTEIIEPDPIKEYEFVDNSEDILPDINFYINRHGTYTLVDDTMHVYCSTGEELEYYLWTIYIVEITFNDPNRFQEMSIEYYNDISYLEFFTGSGYGAYTRIRYLTDNILEYPDDKIQIKVERGYTRPFKKCRLRTQIFSTDFPNYDLMKQKDIFLIGIMK